MMKKYIIQFTYVFLIIFTISCDDYLDVNHDPNVLGDTDQPKILLPTAQVGLAHTLMGWDFGFGGAYWSQYWTQSYTASQFKDLCEYEETSFEDAYEELTAGVLMDAKRIKLLSTEEDNNAYAYIAEALSIFTWQVVTDVWGNVPYTEALKGNEGISSPKFDNGEDIYKDLEVRIDALLATDISTFTAIDAKFDFVYAGSMADWEKFANSLKLKLMMRQSETAGYDNAAVLTFIQANSFLETSAKISGSVWDDAKEGKRHPMREFQEGGANTLSTNVIGTKNFIDYLNNNTDPRIDMLFTAPDGGIHLGAFPGDFDSKADTDLNGTDDEDEEYSEALFAADTDLIILSEWEVNFFIAEAYARGNNLAKAKEHYDLAITASLAQNEITDTAIITTGYATWDDGTIEENIEQIAMQKWVASANYQHLESFIDRNRTKYPAVDNVDIKADRNDAFLNFPVGKLTISVAGRDKSNGNLPSSAVYSTDVLARNINSPSQKADLLQKVWWDKKIGK